MHLIIFNIKNSDYEGFKNLVKEEATSNTIVYAKKED